MFIVHRFLAFIGGCCIITLLAAWVAFRMCKPSDAIDWGDRESLDPTSMWGVGEEAPR